MQESDMGLTLIETWLNETTSRIFFILCFILKIFLKFEHKEIGNTTFGMSLFSESLIWAVLVTLCHYINISEIRY